jgi:hypothetical protein
MDRTIVVGAQYMPGWGAHRRVKVPVVQRPADFNMYESAPCVIIDPRARLCTQDTR